MEILPAKKIKIIDIKGRGRGVVATKNIARGEIIEFCPIVFISEKEASFFEKENTVLKFYWLLQPETKKSCLMLGYGSLYNHSKNPNAEADYDIKKSKDYLFFRALKKIKAGEEIVFDYQFDDDKEEFLKLD
ncbi:MAG: SET domain-containing protein-lysine N-methyltransferase [Candidatus Staskawiczbacteria bacterium]|nr:SET domain-containing protein-lysine N-methyltransferase [Candidatus Staskawiczbacteria bacterium]